MTRTRFQGLLVDYGGVLTVPEEDVFAAICRGVGAAPDRLWALVERAYDGSDPDGFIARRERGELDADRFLRELASALSEGGATVDPIELRESLTATDRPDPAMLGAIARARAAGVRVGLVSNAWSDGGGQRAMVDLVDVLVLSGPLGMRKPEPRIYLRAAELVRAAPSACVFVDDLPANVRGAEAVGMRAIVHRDAATTVAALERLFDLPLAVDDDASTHDPDRKG